MLQRQCIILSSSAFVLFHILFWVTGVHAQGRYEAELAKAEQEYNEGFFDQAINLVNTCLSKGNLTTAEQAWAYKLLGQAYISKNEFQPARINAQKLIEVSPDYEPDQDQDLQMWIELVKEVKQEREKQIQQQQLPEPPDEKTVSPAKSTNKGRNKKWLWIGSGGTVIAGTAVFLIFKGEDTKKRLPDPPGLPSRP